MEMIDKTTRTLQLKEHCLKNGFTTVGIAPVEILTDEFERYKDWIDQGFHGTMSYLEKATQRQNILELLPEARSVVVTGSNYYTPNIHPSQINDSATASITGKISRYAWGEDYHLIVKERLKGVKQFLQTTYQGSTSKSYVDTGPILEKAWAVRAGIGWQGKHSNVISKSIGSWFFIGIILSSVEFEYDSPIPDYCGTCTACLDACPTKAIIEPYTVDATKCISYWTIETKPNVPIPTEIAQNLDNWAFGCDTCQDVCPWNRFQQDSNEELFSPKQNETILSSDVIFSMKQEEFSERFRKSPVKRTKLAGLQRNFRALQSNSDSEI